MESMLQTQEELKQGSQKINSMLQEMDNKKVCVYAFKVYTAVYVM